MPVLNTNPPWLKKSLVNSDAGSRTYELLSGLGVNTVCQSAACPNLNECFSRQSATFLILGDRCTRNCAFCAVKKGLPQRPDSLEPSGLRRAVERLGLDYVVITSVTRDDLEDGGAGQFVDVMRAIRDSGRPIGIEVLVPDFKGASGPVDRVLSAGPDVFSHNVETVKGLYPFIRSGADYERSLALLRRVKSLSKHQMVKSGIMVGLGEKEDEIFDTVREIADTGCDLLTIGQYLRPGKLNISVKRYVAPEEFSRYREFAEKAGIKFTASGPFVRSSYRAKESYLVVSGKS